MKIGIGSDHRGYELKESLKKAFDQISWDDVGTSNSSERVDYPVFVNLVCKKVLSGEVDRGVLICGSGIGVSIGANRFKGIYASLCWSTDIAVAARKHDNSNILALPADFVSSEKAASILDSWLKTEFNGGVYQDRLKMLDLIK